MCGLSVPAAETLDRLAGENRDRLSRAPRARAAFISENRRAFAVPLEIALAAGDAWAAFVRAAARQGARAGQSPAETERNRTAPAPEPEAEAMPEAKPVPAPDPEPVSAPEAEIEPVAESVPEPIPEPEAGPVSAPEAEIETVPESIPEPISESEPEPAAAPRRASGWTSLFLSALDAPDPAFLREIEARARAADPNENWRAQIPFPTDESVLLYLTRLRLDPLYAALDGGRESLFLLESPRNNDSDRVLQKLEFIAQGYGVRVTRARELALWIAGHGDVMDEAIRIGDETAVEWLRGHGALGGYELASRYCWCHAPQRFPLMTRACIRALKELRRRNGRGDFSKADLQTYRAYLRLLDHIMRVYELTVCTPAQFALFLDTVGTACNAQRRGISRAKTGDAGDVGC